jgi:hypothetical protein
MKYQLKLTYLSGIFFSLFSPLMVKAASNLGDLRTLLGQVGGKAGYKTDNTATPEALIGRVIEIFLSFIGVLFLVLFIYAGYLWMTARGNEQQVTKSQDIMKAAVIGLIIVLAAYAITYFVVKEFGSDTLVGVQ